MTESHSALPFLADQQPPLRSLLAKELFSLFLSFVLVCAAILPLTAQTITTGQITGIIDWAEAEVLPFGLALYGLENLLGYMGTGRMELF